MTAPLPGKIIALKVKVGDKVKAGQEVVILEAMKMENSITSDVAGTIKQILVQEGDNVANRCHPGGSGRIAPFRKYHRPDPENQRDPGFLFANK